MGNENTNIVGINKERAETQLVGNKNAGKIPVCREIVNATIVGIKEIPVLWGIIIPVMWE